MYTVILTTATKRNSRFSFTNIVDALYFAGKHIARLVEVVDPNKQSLTIH